MMRALLLFRTRSRGGECVRSPRGLGADVFHLRRTGRMVGTFIDLVTLLL